MTKLAKSFDKGPAECTKRRKVNDQDVITDCMVEMDQNIEIGTDLKTDAIPSKALDQDESSNRLAYLE